MSRITIAILMLVVLVGGWKVYEVQSHRSTAGHTHIQEIWYCPMHTFYTSDKPGSCAICGMTLVKKVATTNSKKQGDDHSTVYLNDKQQALIGIQTTQVVVRPLVKNIRVAGFVAHDLELYEAQLEYIDAWRQYYSFLAHKPTKDEFRLSWREYYKNPSGRSQSEEFRKAQQRLIKAEYALVHMGITEDQLQQLRQIKFGQPWVQPQLLFFSTEHNVWIYAQVYEDQIGYIAPGQKASVEIPSYHQTFEGIVRAVSDVVDPMTRTLRVRIELINGAHDDLKANMLTNISITSQLNDGVIVPSTAVLNTGTRNVVFVKTDEGVFEPRTVIVEAQTDADALIKEGLKAGEEVVVEGNFLLDSESRLEASHG